MCKDIIKVYVYKKLLVNVVTLALFSWFVGMSGPTHIYVALGSEHVNVVKYWMNIFYESLPESGVWLILWVKGAYSL